MPSILHVSRSSAHDFSKQPQASLRLIANQGVEHDTHCGATAQHLYHQRTMPGARNLCQVHLLPSEKLVELASIGFPLEPGELGENILTSNLDLLALPSGTLLHLGPGAVVEVTGLRTPCIKIDQLRAGLQQHLWGAPGASGQKPRQAGVMSVVRTGGIVHPGDLIRIEVPPEPHLALRPIEAVMREAQPAGAGPKSHA